MTKKSPLEIHEIKKMLEHAENGFDDLINTLTKRFKELEINSNEYSTEYLFELLIKNPLLIKLPIIIDDKKLGIGFNEREIRCFLPKEYRRTLFLNSGGYMVEEEL